MNREILDINDCTILLEEANTLELTLDSCFFDEPVIAIAFYGAGDVELKVKYKDQLKEYQHTKGMVLSFYADNKVEFEHTVSALKPLKCLVFATTIQNLNRFSNGEVQYVEKFLSPLINPTKSYVEGPVFTMTPEMYSLVDQFFNNEYQGGIKMMFYRSHMSALLSHYFGQLAKLTDKPLQKALLKKLNQAQEILLNDLENPPSLTELAQQIGLNTNKLKKEFKAQFGVPVFKYLQNERLNKAHHLIKQKDFSIQEVAWTVGYDSLGSFSNAFEKKFGYRPSQLV